MLLPLLLIVFATLSSAVMAYGTHPAWANLDSGLSFIMFARRIEWPLAALAILLCVILIGLVVAGKRNVWWLIGLAPVLALFAHKFATDPVNRLNIVESPTFVEASDAKFMHDEDPVVGVVFSDEPYAYPYAALYRAPIIVQSDHDKRMMLMWSWLANRAVATTIDRDLKARELDIVSMPAGALLVYNARLGQFINGLTGQTPRGEKPDGFKSSIDVSKMTWKEWRTKHPKTRVLAPSEQVTFYAQAPKFALPKLRGDNSGVAPETRIALVATTQPMAVRESDLNSAAMNLSAGDERVVMFRDANGALRAFDRHVEVDLAPRFAINHDEKRKVFLIDAETNTGWSAAGVALDGESIPKGHKLREVEVDEDLFWGVMKRWYPNLQIATPLPTDFASPQPAHLSPPKKRAYHRN